MKIIIIIINIIIIITIIIRIRMRFLRKRKRMIKNQFRNPLILLVAMSRKIHKIMTPININNNLNHHN
jgi:hypothetical protein